jgi:dTDP-4-dehydrorhamnose 3,5-epimerase
MAQRERSMEFETTPLPGLLLVRSDVHRDERGSFFRTFCRSTFAGAGVAFEPTQWSESRNGVAGTLRGLHFQGNGAVESKLVRCIGGRVFDVAVDIRRNSPTYGRWHGVTLAVGDGAALFIPPGFAHGFQTLEDDTAIGYAISPDFVPGDGRGIAWNDPAIGIDWPILPPCMMSQRDMNLSTLKAFHL